MLPAAITITSSSGGPGTYTCNAIFSNSSKAKYVNVGDILEDRLGNKYSITSWVGHPSDFVSSGTLTVTFLDSDVAPATFSSFGDASIYTDGQVDVRPVVRTVGQILSQSVASGQNFTYNITCAWGNTSEAQKAHVGDSIVDSSGKEYVITIKDNANFTSGVIQEVNKEGITPAGGSATLYRPTANYDFFQGTELTDAARTVIQNRDGFLVDKALKTLSDSISLGSSGSIVLSSYTNNTGSTIDPWMAVSTNNLGEISICNVSDEDSVQALKGISIESIPDGIQGQVAKLGLSEDITTTFAVQDAVYVAKDGTLTNVPPEIGSNGFVAGDFVVYIGHISKNELNPTLKDLELKPRVVGQL